MPTTIGRSSTAPTVGSMHDLPPAFRPRAPAAHLPLSQWGVAAPCSSAQFRAATAAAAPAPASVSDGANGLLSRTQTLPAVPSLPRARRWDHLLTRESRARKGSALKAAARFLSRPGLVSLGGGLPSAEYFPFAELRARIADPAPRIREEEPPPPAEEKEEKELVAGHDDLARGTSLFDVATALNYGQGSGSAQLMRWVTEHSAAVHAPPYADWACNLTVGSTSAFDMALRMLCARGDGLLVERYTFPTALETAMPLGVRAVGVELDAQGMCPRDLERVLAGWDEAERGGVRRPRVLYVVPTGQNPTGATMGAQRRRDIYEACQRWDVFILEDEPYYFLQMPEYGAGPDRGREPPTHAEFLAGLIPSFLSMDVDGRVMRLDSFSKVVAPGCRLGWVTACEQVVERYRMHVDASTQGPSGFSQLLLFKLLDERWGHVGYLDWLMHLRGEYARRRDVIVRACERHLPREVVSWVAPRAGMFVSLPPTDKREAWLTGVQHWLRVDWRRHPRAGALSHEEIEELVFMASVERGALVTKGSWFYADEGFRAQDAMFFRATFAAAPEGQIDLAIRRFGAAVRDVFGLDDGPENADVGRQNGVLEDAVAQNGARQDDSRIEVSGQNGFHQRNGDQGCNGHA
jgi:aromatic amino acid aminotransferase I